MARNGNTRSANFRNGIISSSRVLVLIGLFVVFWIFTDNFFGIGNYSNIANTLLQEAPFMMLIGLCMVIPMVTGGIDCSVGSNVSLSAYMCAMVLQATNSTILGIMVGLCMGALVGLVNGLLIAKVHVPPFVATYAMSWVAKGAVLVISKGAQINGFTKFCNQFKAWRGTYLVVALGILVVLWFIYTRTTFGRKMYHVGSNPTAAKLSGMRADGITISAYVIAGLVAAMVGMMYISKLSAAEPTLGDAYTMDAFAAALIGGASFTGAKSKIQHAIVGGLIVVVLDNGLIHIGVPSVWTDLVEGIVIIAAVVMERAMERLRPTESEEQQKLMDAEAKAQS